jgi:hypothetical protein
MKRMVKCGLVGCPEKRMRERAVRIVGVKFRHYRVREP